MSGTVFLRGQALPRLLVSLVLPSFLMACAATEPNTAEPVFDSIQRITPTAELHALDLEDPGKIIVTRGSACGESDQPGEEDVVELAGSFDLPAYANAATVLLDGWRLAYLGGDEHMRGISARIVDIELRGGQITWVARGHLADDDFKDGYEFCYHYTVLAWNDGLVDALADHDNDNTNARASYFTPKDRTALGALSSYVENPEFGAKAAVAILPRGFSIAWANESSGFPIACFDCPVDHHLLQIGANMDHAEAFVQRGEDYDWLPPPAGSDVASRYDSAIRSWETYSILKDDARRHDVWFREHFTGLGGDDIGTVEPPFTILPREDIGLFTGCIGSPTVVTREVEIRDLPFDYAVPMLTGWELFYGCDDEHVKAIGIRIEEIEYDKDPAAPTGTLRYTVVSELKDDDDFPGHGSRHKVTILGLNGREPADLRPHQAVPGFCDKDAEGRLIVSVANDGPGDALASASRVIFSSGGTVELMTPPLPAGFIGTADPVRIPLNCTTDCNFSIAVDSQSEVTETNESNNLASGTCIG